jgi:hypothetical protein
MVLVVVTGTLEVTTDVVVRGGGGGKVAVTV